MPTLLQILKVLKLDCDGGKGRKRDDMSYYDNYIIVRNNIDWRMTLQ